MIKKVVDERARLQRKLKDCLYWARMRSANRPALPKIDIDLPYLERLWRRQEGSCALTGAPLELSGAFGITIDRTNPCAATPNATFDLSDGAPTRPNMV